MKVVKVVFVFAIAVLIGTNIFAQSHSKADSTKTHGKKMEKACCDYEKMSSKKENMKHEMMEGMHDKMDKKDADASKTADVKIWNKVCPVQGEEVDPEAPTTEYNGKTIGFCCPGCDKKFKKDPERYMKNLSEDGTTFLKK